MAPDPLAGPDPAENPSRREQYVTHSGFRIVGPGARELAARLNRPPSVTPGRDEDMLFAARLEVRPRLGVASPLNTVLSILGQAVGRHCPDPPPLIRDQPLNLPAARFAGLTWEILSEPGDWAGELLWRHPHPVVAGAPCTTHVLLLERNGPVTMHLRVTADLGRGSVHGPAGAGQARPAFLTELNRTLRLRFDGFDATPRYLADESIEGFARDVLLADDREYPVALLTPLEEGGYAVPADELADALLGIAPLWVIERHPTTFRLTDALGDRRLSAYWGAFRVYQPGFSCADSPPDHPLLMRERLADPVMRAALFGRLAIEQATRHSMPPGVHQRRATPHGTADPGPAASLPAAAAAPVAPGVTAELPEEAQTPTGASPGVLAGLERRLESIAGALAQLTTLTAGMLDEMGKLRTANTLRAVSTNALERRIGELQELLRGQWPGRSAPEPAGDPGHPATEVAREAPEEAGSVTLVEVLRHAAESHPDALLILEPAERSAGESPYEDVDRVGVTLDAMADIARRRQEGALGMSLRQAFREMGLDYRGGISEGTSERLRDQHRVAGPGGTLYECLEHIALGNAYDPRYCLRIYFTSRAPLEPRFVIGHVGRHFDVPSTT